MKKAVTKGGKTTERALKNIRVEALKAFYIGHIPDHLCDFCGRAGMRFVMAFVFARRVEVQLTKKRICRGLQKNTRIVTHICHRCTERLSDRLDAVLEQREKRGD